MGKDSFSRRRRSRDERQFQPLDDDTTYGAPIGSVDLCAFDDEGNAYEIFPCPDCLPWHAEVVVDEEAIYVREWHAVGCQLFQQLIRREGA